MTYTHVGPWQSTEPPGGDITQETLTVGATAVRYSGPGHAWFQQAVRLVEDAAPPSGGGGNTCF